MNKSDEVLATFEAAYRAHVAMVVAGDLRGVMGDMAPDSLAHVFDGVAVPRGTVDEARIAGIAIVDGRGIGEAVYRTPDGDIGLRSGWALADGRWLADHLENFDPAASSS